MCIKDNIYDLNEVRKKLWREGVNRRNEKDKPVASKIIDSFMGKMISFLLTPITFMSGLCGKYHKNLENYRESGGYNQMSKQHQEVYDTYADSVKNTLKNNDKICNSVTNALTRYYDNL